MINEQKILDYLQDVAKVPLVEVNKSHDIIVSSAISNLKPLIEFVEPLHYWLSYVCGKIYIKPR